MELLSGFWFFIIEVVFVLGARISFAELPAVDYKSTQAWGISFKLEVQSRTVQEFTQNTQRHQ